MKRVRNEASSADASSSFGPRGLHQKHKIITGVLHADDEPSGMPQSELATLLVREWAWGNISTPMVQKVAAAAHADGCKHKDVEPLASLGTWGMYPNNTHRDLLYKLQAPIAPPALADIKMWLKLPFMQSAEVKQKFLMPHALFAQIYEYDQNLFEQVFMGGDKMKVVKFWDEISTTRRYTDCNIKTRPDHTTRCIPLGLHGDGVTVTGVGRSWGKQADVYSWTSLLTQGAAKATNFLIWACYTQNISLIDGKETMDEFWDTLVWSLKALERGQWPSHDKNGTKIAGGRTGPLAGGYYATMWTLQGDLDYFAKNLHLENCNSHTPCMLCEANTTDTPWTAVNPDSAEWMTALWSSDDWGPAHVSVPPIFDLPDVGLHAICPDWMHCKHLGVDQYLFGSVLMLLTHQVGGSRILDGEPAANLAKIWKDIQPTNGTFSDLRLSMYVPTAEHFPVLKGRAAEIRNFGTPLLKVWEKYMDTSNQQHRQVRLALMASIECERILDSTVDHFVLAGDHALGFRKSCFDLAALISGLGHFYHSRGVFLFHITVKTHYLMHFGLSCTELSPRVGWCYSGEDMMGRVKTLVQASCRGTAPQKLMPKLLQKYSIGLSFYLMTPACWWV